MITILIAEFKQETNTFIAGHTTLENFKARNFLVGSEILSYFHGNRNEIGGFISVLTKRDDVRIIPSIAANALPGPIVQRNVYDFVRATLLEDIRNADALDGILLSFHGAMVVEGIEDPEGSLLEDIRLLVGGAIPICISMDFHANVTEKMAENATLMFPFRRYPHIDMYESGVCTAEALLAILDGKIQPVMRIEKLPILCPLITSDEEPFISYLKAAAAYEEEEDVISASVSAGFPYADITEGGMCVIAQTNGNPAKAEQIAETLSKMVEETKHQLKLNIIPPAEAVKIAIAQEGTTVLADAVDNPGAGSPGDATEILHELIRQKAHNAIFATMYDPQVAAQAAEAGPGATIQVSLGGKSDPRVGPPVVAKAYVKSVSDGIFPNKGVMSQGVVNHLGTTAVLLIDGIKVIVASNRYQPWDPEVFRANGIEPTEASIIVLKSSIHYRAAFGKFAAKMIAVNAPNVWTLDLQDLGIKNCRRPIYPLDTE
ncbi:MAG: M81 family metallopeptidase [Bacillota bacterium]